MSFQVLTGAYLEEMRQILGHEFVLVDEVTLKNYGHDETEDIHFQPEVVVKPCNTQEVSQILKLCNKYQIPVTPRGGGTGLSGGALPVYGGVVLSTERLNKIIEIDEKNLQALVEPGVITLVFQETVKEKGLFYFGCHSVGFLYRFLNSQAFRRSLCLIPESVWVIVMLHLLP